MTRQVTDQLYIDLGYLTPEDYYTYRAEAVSNQTCETSVTMSVTVGVIRSAESALTVTTIVAATISNIYGADLFAFTEAELAAQVDRIRGNNIQVTGAYTVTANAERTRYISGSLDTISSIAADNLRVRYSEAAVDAAFSLAAEGTVLAGGELVEATGNWTAESTLAATAYRIQEFAAEITSAFDPTVVCNVVTDISINLSITTQLDATINRIRDLDAVLEVSAELTLSGNETSEFAADLTALTSQQVTATRTAGLTSNVESTTTLESSVDKFVGFDSSISSESTASATYGLIKEGSSYENALFTPSIDIVVTKNSFAVLEAQSTLSATGQVSVSRSISVSAQTSLTAQIKALKESAEADLINTFTLQVSAVKLKKTSAAIAAQATLTATPRETSRLVAALSSAFALSANPTEYATGSNQLISTTESLIHFNTSPIIDVRGAGTPVVSKRDTPGTTTTITNPTLVTGKFGNTINTIESGYSYRIAETTSINIVSDFTAEVWFNYQGDIPNYGAVDSNLLSVSPSQSITYTAWNGVVTTRDFSTSIWVYDKAYHDFAANSQPAYDWGLANGTIYLNWNPTRITAPPAGQITNVIIPVGWNHFLISRSGTYWYFFINGVLKKSWFGSPNGSTSTAISMGNGSIAGLYDEFRLRKDVAVTSNFALPTTEYFPPNPQYVHYSYGLWNTTATLTADYQRVKLFSSTMQSTASSSISANRYRGSGTTNMSVVLTQQTIGQKNAILASSISTTATESITYKRFRTTASQVTATTSQTTHATVVTVTNVAAQVTTEAVIINARTRACDAQITTTANLTCAAQTTARTQLALTAFNSQVAAAAKIGRGLIGLDIEVTMEVQAKVTTDTPIQVNSTSDLTAIASNVLFGDSQALVEANLTVTNDYLRRNESIQEVTTEVNALASRTLDNSSISTATTSLLAVTEDSKIPGVSAQLESTTAIVVDNQIVRLAQAELQAIALMPQVIPGVMVRYEAHLIAEGFVLTAGQILHIDPYYQLKIEPEHRGLIITQEHRVITIEQETRVNKISGYKL